VDAESQIGCIACILIIVATLYSISGSCIILYLVIFERVYYEKVTAVGNLGLMVSQTSPDWSSDEAIMPA